MAKEEEKKEYTSRAPTKPEGMGAHQTMCDRLFKLVPMDRAKENTAYFSMLFFSLVGRQPEEKETEEAQVLMEAFFIEHNVPIPNPAIFIPMIKLVAKDGLTIYQKELHATAMQAYLTTRNRIPSWEYHKK